MFYQRIADHLVYRFNCTHEHQMRVVAFDQFSKLGTTLLVQTLVLRSSGKKK
jgi:hypothetical protein